MKKKFTYGLLLMAGVCLSGNVFTSCKDYEDDLRQEMNRNDQQLRDLLEELKASQEACKQSCQDQFTNILVQLAGKADADKLNSLQTSFNELIARIGTEGKTWTEAQIRALVLEYCNYNYIKGLGFITKEDIPAYLTRDELEKILVSKGYITLDQLNSILGDKSFISHQELTNILSNYLTKSEVENLINGKGYISRETLEIILSGKGYLTQEDINKMGFLTAKDLEGINTSIANITTQLTRVFGQGGLVDQVTQLQADYNTLNDLYNALSGTVNNNYGDLSEKYGQLSAQYTKLIEDLTNGKYGLTKEQVMQMIQEAYATQIQEIQTNITNLQNDMRKYDQEIININKLIADVNGNITDINGEIIKINDQIININTLLENLTSRISDLEQLKVTVEDFGRRISTLETQIVDVTNRLDGQDVKLNELDGRLTTAEANAINALNLAQYNSTRIDALQNLYDQLAADLQTVQGYIGDMTGLTNLADEIRALKAKDENLQQQLDAQSQKDQELDAAIKAVDDALNTHLQQYATDLEALQNRVKANEDAIQEIKNELERVTKLENRLNSLITSMIVQGVYNPVFGTFSLPIGVQSNMLVNYYGYSEKQNYSFPSTQQIASVDNQPQLTQAEYDVLQASGLVPDQINNGDVLIEQQDANLGKVFLTINPNNVDFTGGDLTLVNSQDNACTVKLKNLKRSDEILKFGYSARAAQNGFYEADAYLEPNLSAIEDVRVKIDANLKTSVKDILSDGRSGLRSNVLNLMKALYDQVNGMLPAYGLKAAWNVNGQNFAVYSNYNIAATTFRPLSFSFMYGQSAGNRRLPIVDPISNAIISINAGDYYFDFSDIKINVNTDGIKFDFTFTDMELNYDGSFNVTVSGEVDGKNVTLSGEVDPKDLNAFLESIRKQFNQQANEKWNADVQRAFQSALEQLNTRIDDAIRQALLDMQGKINDNIDKMITDIQDEINNKVGSYIDRFNSFINRYNNIARRINKFLDNPNYYLQPTIFYRGSNQRDFLLSTNSANPTVLVKDGGDAFMIYATSYNAEIVAPSYKKVVAVTDVIDNATGRSVSNAQAQCVAINRSADFLAQVCPGYQKRFVIPTSNMKPGYTYEILYTAVDYQGVTATGRYYVTMR